MGSCWAAGAGRPEQSQTLFRVRAYRMVWSLRKDGRLFCSDFRLRPSERDGLESAWSIDTFATRGLKVFPTLLGLAGDKRIYVTEKDEFGAPQAFDVGVEGLTLV